MLYEQHERDKMMESLKFEDRLLGLLIMIVDDEKIHKPKKDIFKLLS